jgi:hypothetical protein
MTKHANAKYSDEELTNAVSAAKNVSDALRRLGDRPDGHRARELLRRTKKLGIPTAHLTNPPQPPQPPTGGTKRVSAENLLVRLPKGSARTKGARLTKALIETGVAYVCAEDGCNVAGSWLGKRMVLQVDHVDGDGDNNLRTNLRSLCPNCHSQTENFSGRKNRRNRCCSLCNKVISKKGVSGRCQACWGAGANKIVWPSVETLQKMLAVSNFSAVGRELGVSDNAIRKHLKRHAVKQYT